MVESPILDSELIKHGDQIPETDSQVTDAPTLDEFVLLKRLPASCRVTLDVLNRFKDVLQSFARSLSQRDRLCEHRLSGARLTASHQKLWQSHRLGVG